MGISYVLPGASVALNVAGSKLAEEVTTRFTNGAKRTVAAGMGPLPRAFTDIAAPSTLPCGVTAGAVVPCGVRSLHRRVHQSALGVCDTMGRGHKAHDDSCMCLDVCGSRQQMAHHVIAARRYGRTMP